MLEHLTDSKRGNFGPGSCKIAEIARTLEDKDRQILEAVNADINNYSTYGIYRGLRQAGIEIGYATLDRHRKNLCACEVNNAG